MHVIDDIGHDVAVKFIENRRVDVGHAPQTVGSDEPTLQSLASGSASSVGLSTDSSTIVARTMKTVGGRASGYVSEMKYQIMN